MILKDSFDILGADHTTIYTVKAKYIRVEGLPKRCVFVLHRRMKSESTEREALCDKLGHKWTVSEFTSTRILGTGVIPEEAIQDAVTRFSKSDFNGDTIAFKKLCKSARDTWMTNRVEDIPYLEPYEQLSFVRNASLVKKIPVWVSSDD